MFILKHNFRNHGVVPVAKNHMGPQKLYRWSEITQINQVTKCMEHSRFPYELSTETCLITDVGVDYCDTNVKRD